MAHNWKVTGKKLRALKVIDALLWPFKARKNVGAPIDPDGVRNILVVEIWRLGDTVLVTPLLQMLREQFPNASITMLCKEHARVLLENTGLVDEFVHFDFPWTAEVGKYSVSRYKPLALARLIRLLRSKKFDLSLDSRMDVRNNVLTRLIGARYRVGYDFGGGAALLTHALSAGADRTHKVDDWVGLLGILVGLEKGGSRAALATVPAPMLQVADEERDWALQMLGGDESQDLIGVFPSGNSPNKRWPIEKFVELCTDLALKARVVVIVDPDGYGAELGQIDGVTTIQPNLRQLLAVIERCDLLVGNDSGPMHIAAALGVRTVTVFGPGRSDWYAPYHRAGVEGVVVEIPDYPCRPCFDSCIFESARCLAELPVERVRSEIHV